MDEEVYRLPENGGIPAPPPDLPTRVVAARHDACGTETRVRVPGSVPARALRRLICARCAQPFETEALADLGVQDAAAAAATSALRPSQSSPGAARSPRPTRSPAESGTPAHRGGKLRLPGPQSPVWRWAGIPLAALAVVAGVSLLTGGSDEPAPSTPSAGAPVETGTTTASAPADGARQRRGAAKRAKATLVRTPSFTLALPAGWKRTKPSGDAAFAARAPGGAADATLWVEHDPKLSFADFEARSVAQVEALTGETPEVERNPGPTPERSWFTLTAPAPEGAPSYSVVGRLSGPYRYYLATTVQPGAASEVAAGAELIRESFVPEAGR